VEIREEERRQEMIERKRGDTKYQKKRKFSNRHTH
jgi:hypothetical protein